MNHRLFLNENVFTNSLFQLIFRLSELVTFLCDNKNFLLTCFLLMTWFINQNGGKNSNTKSKTSGRNRYQYTKLRVKLCFLCNVVDDTLWSLWFCCGLSKYQCCWAVDAQGGREGGGTGEKLLCEKVRDAPRKV